MRFATSGEVHCELYDGPASFQYYASIKCWGRYLAGVPDGTTQVSVGTGGAAVYEQANFNHLEMRDEVKPTKSPDQPYHYRILEPGHKIVVPGSRDGVRDMNDEVCAITMDARLICEIQHPEYGDHNAHGFSLSPQGSRIY